jgi:hypothetical protein
MVGHRRGPAWQRERFIKRVAILGRDDGGFSFLPPSLSFFPRAHSSRGHDTSREIERRNVGLDGGLFTGWEYAH